MLVEGSIAVLTIPVEDHCTQGGHEHHFVGIANDTVCLFNTSYQVAMSIAKAGRTAMGRVDV